ncbi:Predicted RNA-binding protein containing PIN domain, a fragment [Methanopyrus kandleri AV19]|uniref:Predicted RNA-binding protein containing PIN domain, a n=1 Tax=Methanopyrus kandleri (strain AV19 / DSM 6324 / JCM 9639 / NBRC 100938) TaxID=190192 RepID=Q8TYJ6_METKA|nr:Predicted RNA-binding protein containing PIN domain, a fragment [Methanopyrus kandleri AV19]
MESVYTFTLSLFGCLDVTSVVGPRLMKDYGKNLAGESFLNRCWNPGCSSTARRGVQVGGSGRRARGVVSSDPPQGRSRGRRARSRLPTNQNGIDHPRHFSEVARELRGESLALKRRTPFDFEFDVLECRG